jgi:hypothetical protein
VASVSIGQILDKLGETLDPDKAEELLALALEQLDLPVKEAYTPAEVVAIGTAIADAQRVILAASDLPEARELENAIGPFIDALKQDAPHLK